MNGPLRRYLPKSVDIHSQTDGDLDGIALQMNEKRPENVRVTGPPMKLNDSLSEDSVALLRSLLSTLI